MVTRFKSPQKLNKNKNYDDLMFTYRVGDRALLKESKSDRQLIIFM